MKNFKDLNSSQKKEAINYCLVEIIQLIITEQIKFKSDIQNRINKIMKDNELMPWFYSELLLQDKTIKKVLYSFATDDAINANYVEPSDILPRYIPIETITNSKS